eukprot:6257087-Alexandrium_andersonii.AAC.1
MVRLIDWQPVQPLGRLNTTANTRSGQVCIARQAAGSGAQNRAQATTWSRKVSMSPKLMSEMA